MQQYASTYSVPMQTLDPGNVLKRLKPIFTESSHAAYPINGSTKQEHILSLHTYPLPPDGFKMSNIFFPEVVMTNYKLKEWKLEHHASTYSALTHTLGLRVRSKVKNIFLHVVMLHIKLKGIEVRASYKHIFCPYTYP